MPELPEVEVLVRHLAPLLKNKTVRAVSVRRPRVIRPTTEAELSRALKGKTFRQLTRRGKYLLFTLTGSRGTAPCQLIGHLGMSGRMYLALKSAPLPKHAAVVLDLGKYNFVYEDTRYFGRFTLDTTGVDQLGPEALGPEFTVKYLVEALQYSGQPIKVKLLDQTLVAGVGNIYASESLFRAGISPRQPAKTLTHAQIKLLREAIRHVLNHAVRLGSTVKLNFNKNSGRDKLFYYGSWGEANELYDERFMVYDRAGEPCRKCQTPIQRIVQAARSTFYCPQCQPEAKN
jgi:formamidopyrimidine-DNA glycosylase